MKLCKKVVTLLAAVCLLLAFAPSAMAVDSEIKMSVLKEAYSELEIQVALANGLNSYDYTAESWEPLQKALDNGNKILKGEHGQTVVGNAADAIEDAMGDLVKMDYTALDNALADAYTKLEEDMDLYDVWYRLSEALEEARPLMSSGRQDSVNAMAEYIRSLLAELEEVSAEFVPEGVIYQEVEVEVLPADDYCNIPMHHTWPVLFVVSAVLNVVLVVILVYVLVKKRQTMDTTPLVSYDIDDDMDF